MLAEYGHRRTEHQGPDDVGRGSGIDAELGLVPSQHLCSNGCTKGLGVPIWVRVGASRSPQLPEVSHQTRDRGEPIAQNLNDCGDRVFDS